MKKRIFLECLLFYKIQSFYVSSFIAFLCFRAVPVPSKLLVQQSIRYCLNPYKLSMTKSPIFSSDQSSKLHLRKMNQCQEITTSDILSLLCNPKTDKVCQVFFVISSNFSPLIVYLVSLLTTAAILRKLSHTLQLNFRRT